MPARNDPCPCGSGKKYKHCHQREDEAAPRAQRLIHGTAGAAGRATGAAVRLPPGAVVPTDSWEVDLLPFAAEITDDPTARPTVLLIGAGEYVLSAEVLAHPPSEAREVAALLARALSDASTRTGLRPTEVRVRLAVLVDELAELLAEPEHAAHGARVIESRAMLRVDDALAGLETRAGLPLAEPGALPSSHPQTWAAWGFPPAETARLFAACDVLYKSAPWDVIDDLDVFTVRPREGGAWHVVVFGDDLDVPGIAIYADAGDLRPSPEGGDDTAGNAHAPAPLRGASLSIVFEERESLPKPMRAEVRLARWPVAGPMAHPYLTAINTPGGGITLRQLRALTVAIEAVPGFLEKHADAITGKVEARFPLRYTEKLNGATVEMSDA